MYFTHLIVSLYRKPLNRKEMAKRKKKDLWWYINNEYGISAIKRKFSRKTGIPTTKAGVERKLGSVLLGWLLGGSKKSKKQSEEIEEEEVED